MPGYSATGGRFIDQPMATMPAKAMNVQTTPAMSRSWLGAHGSTGSGPGTGKFSIIVSHDRAAKNNTGASNKAIMPPVRAMIAEVRRGCMAE
jgi:hypothetical protein